MFYQIPTGLYLAAQVRDQRCLSQFDGALLMRMLVSPRDIL